MNRKQSTHANYRLARYAARTLALAVLFVLPGVVAVASGQHEGVIHTIDGVAIGGYDPVAYFTLGAPTQGVEQFTAEWDGAVWWFVSADHRDRFVADPERYAPHYGGYCAQAAAQNQVAEGDPEIWTVEGNRLFLNYNARYQRRFRSDLASNIAAADHNWPDLRSRLAEAEASAE